MTIRLKNVYSCNVQNIFMLTLVSQMFPVLGEVSCCIRTLPNRYRNRARGYYDIVLNSEIKTCFFKKAYYLIIIVQMF